MNYWNLVLSARAPSTCAHTLIVMMNDTRKRTVLGCCGEVGTVTLHLQDTDINMYDAAKGEE